MKNLSVKEVSVKWGISERTVRNYCLQGRIKGAHFSGNSWKIPEDAKKPERVRTLKRVLKMEKQSGYSGGIYFRILVDFTYHSNRIEGNELTHSQVRSILETNSIEGAGNRVIYIDDVLETVNHFRCIDLIIDNAEKPLSEGLLRKLHSTLMQGTSDSRKNWFMVGGYKKLPNTVGGNLTAAPEDVPSRIRDLLERYSAIHKVTLDDILEFHVQFERIHPFQDGNGRIGRLIMLKEFIRYNIIPFIIDDDHKADYFKGLKDWDNDKRHLKDTCIRSQKPFKATLDYFKIQY